MRLPYVLLVYLPGDYFVRRVHPPETGYPLLRLTVVIAKNLVGVVLIGLGAIMLVLPGQGVITMLIGIMLLNFPGKRKLVIRIIRRPRVIPSVNRFRSRFGKAPLIFGESS